MKKFEIRTDHFEFRLGTVKARIPAMSADEIFDTYMSGDTRITSNCLDPKLEASFDTLEAARDVLARDFKYFAQTRLVKGQTQWLLTGEMAWIEENEYTDDGDFDQGGDVYDVLAEAYEPEDREED